MKNQLLIKNCMLTTFFNDGYNATKILQGVDVLIEDGKLKKIDRNITAGCKTIDGTGKLVAPGFINGRSRSLASVVSKSLPEDIKLSRFGNTPLYMRVNPFINIAQEVLSDAQIKSLLKLALFEAISSGTTAMLEYCSVRDLPLYLELCDELGMRAIASPALMSRKTLPETDAWCVCENALEEVDEDALVSWNSGMVKKTAGRMAKAGMGLGSVETASESLMSKVGAAAFSLDCTLMVTANETQQERDVCIERYNKTPAQILQKNHVFHRKTVVGGNQYADHADRVIMKSGMSVAALCPLQSVQDAQIAPFLGFQYDGLDLVIGSGRCIPDMTEQVRLLTLVGKLENRLRHQMRAQKTFFASTIGAGQAIGLPVGELSEGLDADLILIDTAKPHYHPFTLPITDLIYNTSSSDITEVIVAGRLLKENGRVLNMDERQIIEDAESAMNLVWTHARKKGAL
ncbi:MAG: amidohydrolase family protein [Bacillota bacterium]|nr:amidohydrolase family protein [Bacillota bacterium]